VGVFAWFCLHVWMFLGVPRACVGVFGWCGVSGSRVVVCALQVFPRVIID